MKIVFACGGTGGHIFPALSVAEELKKRVPTISIYYVCGKKDIESTIFKSVAREEVLSIESAPFRGALSLLNPSFLLKLFSGFSQSWKFLKKEKPDLVVGFGGYFSFPVVLSAKLLRQKTMIHEQNVLPGMANKFLMRAAGSAALSFAETKKYLPKHRSLRVTGNPIRASIENDCRAEALRFFDFSQDKTTLLVLGGSQGAESINTFFLDALAFLTAEFKQKIQVLHLCGRMKPQITEAAGRKEGVVVRAFSFFDRMDLAYGVCDFALGRAGATFLAEIAAKRIPAILVPYPFAGAHQLENAKVFAQENEAVIVEQKDLSPEKLAVMLTELIQRERSSRISFQTPAPDNARALLADFILESAKK